MIVALHPLIKAALAWVGAGLVIAGWFGLAAAIGTPDDDELAEELDREVDR